MKASFGIGRIAGIRVGVHWSVLIIFTLVGVGLGFRFADTYEGRAVGSYVVAALLTALVFFGSLLAHEMSHAIVARRNGQRVEGITLWLLGGVARLSGEARSPAVEFRVAGVGPAVSVLLGAVFLLGAGILEVNGNGGLLMAALGWLGAINLFLALFNSIPAAPLDGGRLLRSLIWWRTGDRLKATAWSSRAGQAFGWVLIAVGLAAFIGGGFGGIWLALIGWFLIAAATAERHEATVRAQLGQLPVREIMTPDPLTVPGSLTVAELLGSDVIRHRFSTFPLTDDTGAPVGLLTFGQIRRVHPEDQHHTRLADIACPVAQVTWARPEEPAADLLPRMDGGCAEGRALVMSGNTLVGIVSPSDVNRVMRWSGIPTAPAVRESA